MQNTITTDLSFFPYKQKKKKKFIQIARDDRLIRLRTNGRDNLTEAGRQARSEYLFVPHHVARSTLEARNSKYNLVFADSFFFLNF